MTEYIEQIKKIKFWIGQDLQAKWKIEQEFKKICGNFVKECMDKKHSIENLMHYYDLIMSYIEWEIKIYNGSIKYNIELYLKKL